MLPKNRHNYYYIFSYDLPMIFLWFSCDFPMICFSSPYPSLPQSIDEAALLIVVPRSCTPTFVYPPVHTHHKWQSEIAIGTFLIWRVLTVLLQINRCVSAVWLENDNVRYSVEYSFIDLSADSLALRSDCADGQAELKIHCPHLPNTSRDALLTLSMLYYLPPLVEDIYSKLAHMLS